MAAPSGVCLLRKRWKTGRCGPLFAASLLLPPCNLKRLGVVTASGCRFGDEFFAMKGFGRTKYYRVRTGGFASWGHSPSFRNLLGNSRSLATFFRWVACRRFCTAFAGSSTDRLFRVRAGFSLRFAPQALKNRLHSTQPPAGGGRRT
ncbi:hypothetical protein SDC9_156736 [bioreactor metagenome]|uniref:Uncharacterized protein n=1 Tax=bioreactor metagenome TaxID=1076179 RepID=A0A645F714_9ZZZZ